MAADIAPELFKKISAEFKRLYERNPKIKSLLEKINAGTATYVEAAEYAELVGRTCSGAMLRFLGDDMLPDSRLYYNIAERTVRPMLEQSRDMVEEIAISVQENLNKAAGLNMKAAKPKLDDSRVKNIIDKVSDAEKFSDASWVLGDPVVNLSMNVVDETVKANAEFHSKSGMKAMITRRQTSKCCDWCANLAGKYSYPDVPEDVYRRHENCRCIVTYVPQKGKAQDVWSKKEYTSEREAVEDRLAELENRASNSGQKQNKTNRLNTHDDPMVEVTGPAEDSNPVEIKAFTDELKELGVELERPDKEELTYQPAPIAGKPGKVVISRDSSFSAWKHEMQHVYDDRDAGWSGLQIFQDKDEVYRREEKAYNIEIEDATLLNRLDIVERLKDNLEKERSRIYE